MIYAYKERNKNGDYQTAAGTRYIVHFASRLHGKVRDCWKAYDSKEAALASFKLIPYMDDIDESESYEYTRE